MPNFGVETIPMSWKNLFESLGFNTTRWQWRIMRWRNQWENRRRGLRRAKEHTVYKHKICPHCGALMDGKESLCPRCGEKAPSWTGQAAQRFFGLVMPSWGAFSFLLVMANILDLGLGIALFGLDHFFSPQGTDLVRMGALYPPLFFAGEYWRAITYGYLHIGILHIAFNLIVLIQVGPYLEKEIGSARFFTVYTLSLIAGAAADLLFRSGPILVAGASGAMFGLIGFGMSYAHFLGGPTGRAQRNFFLHWAIYGFIFGYIVGADNVAHLGGFVIGAVLGFLVERERLHARRLNPLWNGLAALCVLLTLFSFIGLIFQIKL